MRRHRSAYFKMWAVLLIGLLMIGGPALAQEITPLALSDQMIVLEYIISPVGAPSFDMLSDGRAILMVNGSGTVSGDLEGTMTSNPNQVVEFPEPALDSFAATFTIETTDGTVEGYYIGSLFESAGSSALTINAYGQILSVTGAYADLFLAEVIVSGQVPLGPDGVGTGESGTLIISPR